MTTAATVEIIGQSTVGDVIAADLARARASLDELEKSGSGAALAAGGLSAIFSGMMSGMPTAADQIAGAVKSALDQISAMPGAQIKLLDDQAIAAIHAVASGVEALGVTPFPPVRITADDSDVRAKTKEVEALLAHIHDKTVTITVNIVTNGSAPEVSGGTPAGSGPAHAAGTFAAPGGLSLVGERGPELVSLPRGAGVLSALDTRALLAALRGGGSGGDLYVSTVNINAPPGVTVGDLLSQLKSSTARAA